LVKFGHSHVFLNSIDLIYFPQKSALNPPGTLAYITEEEALLVRVNKGWQYIAVSSSPKSPGLRLVSGVGFDFWLLSKQRNFWVALLKCQI